MEILVLLFVSLLLRSRGAQGSSAVTVFVKKGEDVLLNVTEADDPEEVSLVLWNFNTTDILVNFSPGGSPSPSDYTGRTEFSETNYSLKLKNLQKTDSGVYKAQVVRGRKQLFVEYSVTVQDPVSPVKLSVDSVSNSSGSCNFTVSCRTQDSHINSSFTCGNQSCSQDGGEDSKVTTSGAVLQVYLGNDSIICYHSNQVSRTEDMKIIKDISCQNADRQEYLKNGSAPVVTGVIIALAAIITVPSTVLYFRKRRNSESQNIENTVYEVPQCALLTVYDLLHPCLHVRFLFLLLVLTCVMHKIYCLFSVVLKCNALDLKPHLVVTTPQPLNLNSPDDASVQSPNSTYCLVGQHTGVSYQPESLYAQVDKPARTAKS